MNATKMTDKQTAVEWFQDQIIKIVNGTCELSEIQIFEQAKEMEKEEIIDAWDNGWHEHMNPPDFITSVKYYNETYNK